jgi:hypothetical protein
MLNNSPILLPCMHAHILLVLSVLCSPPSHLVTLKEAKNDGHITFATFNARIMQSPPWTYDPSSRTAPVTDTFDMTNSSTVLPAPPPRHATVEQKMEFLQQQLDSIGRERPILSGLLLLGSGVKDRLQGGALLPRLRPQPLSLVCRWHFCCQRMPSEGKPPNPVWVADFPTRLMSHI